jgi:DNA-binding response OmpR family regulator
MHVLIIEDERGYASDLFEYLQAKGHAVDTASHGITSRNLALAGQYDAIVIDAMLPEMEDFKLCSELRDTGCQATPILVISVRDSLNDKIACLEAGADDFLVKPVAISEIEARLRVLFRMKWRARVSERIGKVFRPASAMESE